MKIDTQSGDDISEIHFSKYDVAFMGDHIDERGEAANKFIVGNVDEIITLNYLPSEFQITINGDSVQVYDFGDRIPDVSNRNILIDATTIGFVELLILLQTLFDSGNQNFSILYVEPASYNKRQRDQLLHYRDFDLSVETLGYEAIPGHALTISDNYTQKVIFLCGFEAERMDRVIEDSEILSKNCKCIFGMPAFKPGWEMDSFANNINIMKGKGMRRDIDFCGATSPFSVYEKLNKTFKGLTDEDQMFVVPLATKPMSIGACLFLASTPTDQVAVLYDHPQKRVGRGIGVGKWHLFNISA